MHLRQGFFSIQQTCPHCHGSGKIIPEPCTTCSGAGKIKRQKTLEVKIPAGINEGMRIRSAGNGEPGTNGGPAGDLYIEIRIKQHEIFERDGDDLHCTVPVGLTTAALGGTIEVPTLGGKAEIELPEGTQHGKTFRLRGKGIKGLRSSYPGDLYCHVTRRDAGQADRAPAQAAEGTRRVVPQCGRPALAERQELDRPRQGPLQVGPAGADARLVRPGRPPPACEQAGLRRRRRGHRSGWRNWLRSSSTRARCRPSRALALSRRWRNSCAHTRCRSCAHRIGCCCRHRRACRGYGP